MIPTISYTFFDVNTVTSYDADPTWRSVKDTVPFPFDPRYEPLVMSLADEEDEGRFFNDIVDINDTDAFEWNVEEESESGDDGSEYWRIVRDTVSFGYEEDYELETMEIGMDEEETPWRAVRDLVFFPAEDDATWRVVKDDVSFPADNDNSSHLDVLQPTPSSICETLPNPFPTSPIDVTILEDLEFTRLALSQQEALTDLFQRQWLLSLATKQEALDALAQLEALADLYQREWIRAETALREEERVANMHMAFWRETENRLADESMASDLAHHHWTNVEDLLSQEIAASDFAHIHWHSSEDSLATEIQSHDLALTHWYNAEDALVDETIAAGLAHEYWAEAEELTSKQETISAIMERNWIESEESKGDILLRNAELIDDNQALVKEVARLISLHEETIHYMSMDTIDIKLRRAELELEVVRLTRASEALKQGVDAATSEESIPHQPTFMTTAFTVCTQLDDVKPTVLLARKRKLSIMDEDSVRSAYIRLDSLLDEPVNKKIAKSNVKDEHAPITRPASAGPTLQHTIPAQHLPAFIFPVLDIPFIAIVHHDANSNEGGLSGLEVYRRRGGEGRRDGAWVETQWDSMDALDRVKFEVMAGLNRVAAAREDQERRAKINREAEIRIGWEML